MSMISTNSRNNYSRVSFLWKMQNLDRKECSLSDFAGFKKVLDKSKNIVALTGAGVSAESGISVFRGAGGFWRTHRSQDLATPQAFSANPSLVWEFYHYRRNIAFNAQPNPAHKALAEFEKICLKHDRQFTVITQNVDGLHQRAGSKNVIELHGALHKVKCTNRTCSFIDENFDNPICEALRGKGDPAETITNESDIEKKDLPKCRKCQHLVRPYIVWFGENLDKDVMNKSEPRKMIIKKVIPQGGLILQEKPFVYTLCSKFRTQRCDFCFKEGELLKCSSCQYVCYCGKECQKAGWSVHKLECRYLGNILPRLLPDTVRLLARLIKILGKAGHNFKSYYTDKDYRVFKDLMSHYSNIKKDQSRMEHFTSIYGVFFDFFDEVLPNSAELMGMYGRVCTNSFSICNQEFQSIGTGIYLAASVVDHSCRPNAVVTFEGPTLVMRALEELPCLDWSKIFISYIDVMALKNERQAELEKNYYFLCQCSKCLEPEPVEMTGAACPDSNCDNCIDSANMEAGQTCQKCGETITKQFIDNFEEVMEMTSMQLDNMKDKTTYLDVCLVCLKKQKGVLYRYNVKHVKMLDLAFDSSIEFQKFNEATEYGLELIKGFNDYYGKFHPMTGLLHLKVGKLLHFQESSKKALDHLEKAREILLITHGCESSIIGEHVIPLLQQVRMEINR